MSSSFHTPQLRPPTDGELAALVTSICETTSDDTTFREIRQQLEEPLRTDLEPQKAVIKAAVQDYMLCRCVKAAACSLVPHLPDDNIRRHAEAATTRRVARGLSPEFPPELQPMRALLAHGGTLSFNRVGYCAVEDSTGRCECFDSTYYGVLSAPLTGNSQDDDGACKHDQLRKLCKQASASSAAAAAVRDHCSSYLCCYLSERERSKPEAQRCRPLYDAGRAGDIDALLTALRSHPSIPPTGKGVASTAEPSEQQGSDSESDDGNGGSERDAAEAAAEALQTLPRRHCSFQASELAANGFGLAFRANDEVDGGMGIVVAAFAPLRSGGNPPATHSGEQLLPCDVVLRVGKDDGDLTKQVSSDGLLAVPAGSEATTLEFVRPVHSSRPVKYLGGRPAKKKPKYGHNARGKRTAWASHVREDELLGGAPSRVSRKPQHSRARDRSAGGVTEPSVSEQMEALLRAVETAGGSSAQQQRELERLASEVEAQVLARRQLGEAARAERDAELCEMVYSQ